MGTEMLAPRSDETVELNGIIWPCGKLALSFSVAQIYLSLSHDGFNFSINSTQFNFHSEELIKSINL